MKGEETARGLFHYIEENNLNKPSAILYERNEWENSHLLVKNYSLSYNEKTIGHVIIGIDITDEKTFDQKHHLDFIIAYDRVQYSVCLGW